MSWNICQCSLNGKVFSNVTSLRCLQPVLFHVVELSCSQYFWWHIYSLMRGGSTAICMLSCLLTTSSVIIFCFFASLPFFLGNSFQLHFRVETRWQHNSTWKTDTHLAINKRLWKRTAHWSCYTFVSYVETADWTGSSKLCTSCNYRW